jgi:histidinol phosphatase-like PHP family hydrolase
MLRFDYHFHTHSGGASVASWRERAARAAADGYNTVILSASELDPPREKGDNEDEDDSHGSHK